MKIEHLLAGEDISGWSEPGWYFWIEDEATVAGPYTTESKAISAADYYAKNI